jgi:hypothetical protein
MGIEIIFIFWLRMGIRMEMMFINTHLLVSDFTKLKKLTHMC